MSAVAGRPNLDLLADRRRTGCDSIGGDRPQRINSWEVPMTLGSLAVAAAMSVFVALSAGPVSAIPVSGSTAGTSASGVNEAYAYYRRGGYRGAYRGGYRRAYYAPRGVYRRTYRRAYRRAAYYPSSYYGSYGYPSSTFYHRPYAYRGAYYGGAYRGGSYRRAYYRPVARPYARAYYRRR